jgi:hypothetical protein
MSHVIVDDFRELIQTSVESSGHLQSLIGDCAFLKFPTHFLPQKRYQPLQTKSVGELAKKKCGR